MKIKRSGQAVPRLVLMLGMLGISLSSILVRFSTAPALALAAWRMVWAVAILTPLILLRNQAELKNLRAKDLLRCAASGLLLALHFVSWFEGIRRTSVANATLLVCTDVIFVALGQVLLLKGRIPRLGLAAMGLALLGSAIIAFGGGSAGQSHLAGDLLSLLGAIFIAGYMLIGKVQRKTLSTNLYTWLTYSSCALALLAACVATQTPMTKYGTKELAIGLALCVLCTLLGHSVLNWSLAYFSPAYVTVAKLSEPVCASILAAFLFGELPTGVQFLGAGVLLAGILLYSRAEGPKQAVAAGKKPAKKKPLMPD